MRINHNITALNSYKNLSIANKSLSSSLEKLSSGRRINRAADDAAGMAISEKMKAQIRGLSQAARNSLDAVSLIQTAEGALAEVQSMLHRMRELSVQAATGTLTDEDRDKIQNEINQLALAIDVISRDTEFNTKKLLRGSDMTQGNTFIFSVERVETATSKSITMDFIGVPSEGDIIMLGDKVYEFVYSTTSTANVRVDLDGVKTIEEAMNRLKDAVENDPPAGAAASVTVEAADYRYMWTMELDMAEDVYTYTVASESSSMFATIQIGANASQFITMEIRDMGAVRLGIATDEDGNIIDPRDTAKKVYAGISVKTPEDAQEAMAIFDNALSMISVERAKLGAYQNRLDHTINNLSVSEENLTASLSRIEDADMALEMSNYVKNNILVQSGMAMLAQANQIPQSVLQLLK